jgi:hypothetical protein
MDLVRGAEFSFVKPDVVIDFLNNRRLQTVTKPADEFRIDQDGKHLYVQIPGPEVRRIAMRDSFFYKLLKWFSFPLHQLKYLSVESLASILNDYLIHIERGDVTVLIENDEALTITSSNYTEVRDLDILNMMSNYSIASVSRNDYLMRIYTSLDTNVEPVEGDLCGIGMNVINSETGFRALSVSSYVYRYRCSNGAIVQTEKNEAERIHYGQPQGELERFLRDRLAENSLWTNKIAANLKFAASKNAGDHIEFVRRKLSPIAGNSGTKKILSQVSASASCFDLFNTLTLHAKNYDASARLNIETLAGELLKRVEN